MAAPPPPEPERGQLKDGREVEIRPIGPGDAGSLEAGLEALSLDSRYRRFLAPKLLRKVGPLDAAHPGGGMAELTIHLHDGEPCPPVVREALRAAARGELELA